MKYDKLVAILPGTEPAFDQVQSLLLLKDEVEKEGGLRSQAAEYEDLYNTLSTTDPYSSDHWIDDDASDDTLEADGPSEPEMPILPWKMYVPHDNDPTRGNLRTPPPGLAEQLWSIICQHVLTTDSLRRQIYKLTNDGSLCIYQLIITHENTSWRKGNPMTCCHICSMSRGNKKNQVANPCIVKE